MLVAMPGMRAEEMWGMASNVADGAVVTAPGIRPDRLPPRKLRAWRAIEAIVFARDDSGRLYHPRLHSLWQWAETSGHVIYIHLVNPMHRWDYQGGRFRIEKLDPSGQKHIAAIELCLPVIDEALVRERARPGDAFIQYEGLGKVERYAEALGHELGHAAWFLSDQNRTRLIYELDREIDYYSHRRQAARRKAWDEQMRQHLNRVESWKDTIEKPAKTAEAEVWRELLTNQGRRSRKLGMLP